MNFQTYDYITAEGDGVYNPVNTALYNPPNLTPPEVKKKLSKYHKRRGKGNREMGGLQAGSNPIRGEYYVPANRPSFTSTASK